VFVVDWLVVGNRSVQVYTYKQTRPIRKNRHTHQKKMRTLLWYSPTASAPYWSHRSITVAFRSIWPRKPSLRPCPSRSKATTPYPWCTRTTAVCFMRVFWMGETGGIDRSVCVWVLVD
jgi:hypothetical protein